MLSIRLVAPAVVIATLAMACAPGGGREGEGEGELGEGEGEPGEGEGEPGEGEGEPGEGEGEPGEGEGEACPDLALQCSDSGDVLDACGVVVDDCSASELCTLHPEDATFAYCNGTCQGDEDCGTGLVCRRYGSSAACVPPAENGASCAGDDGDEFLTHSCAPGLVCAAAPPWPSGGYDLDLCVGPTDRVDYAPCTEDAQCASGVCGENQFGESLCLSNDCANDDDCAGAAVCYSFGGSTECIAAGTAGAACAGTTDDGYQIIRSCAVGFTCTDQHTVADQITRCE